jgi:hypothetical protein
MAQYNRNNWHHIPGIGGIMATGSSTLLITTTLVLPDRFFLRDINIP